MTRQSVVFFSYCLVFLLIISRLFYWQVISGSKLAEAAVDQYYFTLKLPALRGTIVASDQSPLVTNKTAYLVYSEPPKIENKTEFAKKVSEILEVEENEIVEQIIKEKIVWAILARKVGEDAYKKLNELSLPGLGFEKESTRYYPEGSMSAHLLGFVGSDENGEDKGYFGLEGFYNRALYGKQGTLLQEKDARGLPILVGGVKRTHAENGQSLELYVDRSVQLILEEKLKEGLQKYGAKSGLVALMDPKSGGILGSAAYPNYDPAQYREFPEGSYLNPLVAQVYEPGSTFKALVMAAALNERLVDTKTVFDESGPVKIGEYSIRTWNDEYHGKLTMTQVLEKSSNPGMVFVGQKLGKDRLVSYINKYGFGEETGIDLEEEDSAPMRPEEEWKEIDLATSSFGQGIAVTPIQMLQAINVLANEGKLIEPHIVKKMHDPSGKTIEVKPKLVREVLRPATARIITEMLISAVDHGEAKWAKPPGYRIAGKTGTAQIPVEGHYDAEKTIASFVGFAPADDPKFVMLVILREPTSSPWGSETAAPLFFTISKELFSYYGISPKG